MCWNCLRIHKLSNKLVQILVCLIISGMSGYWYPWIHLDTSIRIRPDTGLDTKKKTFGFGYRFGYQEKKFRIRIPVWIPKKFFPDSDTGLDTKNFFSGFGYRFGYQKKIFRIRIPVWIPKKKIPDSDTGLDTKKKISGFGYRFGYQKKNFRIRIPVWIPKKL